MTPRRRATGSSHVVLIGAGHTHLEVVRQAPQLARAGVDLTLVAPDTFVYSGLASAVVTGTAAMSEATVEVARLARRNGVAHVRCRAEAVDPRARRVTAVSGDTIDYDVLSVNIGSVAAVGSMDVAVDVDAVKPFERLTAIRALIDTADASGLVVSVVGGGATGVELAGHLQQRFGRRAAIHLFERGPSLLANFPPGAQAATLRRFRRRGVTVHLDTPVCRLTTHGLDTGRRWHAHDVAVLATGLVAHPDVERMGLGGHDGIPVDETLQHVSYDDIYAVGDCAHRVDAPLPKIGVYAVRQGPVLVESLLARRRGDALPRFAAADHVLQIVDLGDGTAVAARGRRWFAGRLPRVVKRRIDRRWLDRYRC